MKAFSTLQSVVQSSPGRFLDMVSLWAWWQLLVSLQEGKYNNSVEWKLECLYGCYVWMNICDFCLFWLRQRVLVETRQEQESSPSKLWTLLQSLLFIPLYIWWQVYVYIFFLHLNLTDLFFIPFLILSCICCHFSKMKSKYNVVRHLQSLMPWCDVVKKQGFLF